MSNEEIDAIVAEEETEQEVHLVPVMTSKGFYLQAVIEDGDDEIFQCR